MLAANNIENLEEGEEEEEDAGEERLGSPDEAGKSKEGGVGQPKRSQEGKGSPKLMMQWYRGAESFFFLLAETSSH